MVLFTYSEYSQIPRFTPSRMLMRKYAGSLGVYERTAIVQENVLWLDVAMNDVLATRVVERAGDFARDAHREGPREWLRKRILDIQFRKQREVAVAGQKRVDAVRDADHGDAHRRARWY